MAMVHTQELRVVTLLSLDINQMGVDYAFPKAVLEDDVEIC